MKLSKDQEYLATIKRNHKVVSHLECDKRHNRIDKIWGHLKALKNIRRLSGITLIQPYTVAIHCYYTGLLFEEIADYEKIRINKSEIDFVYRHDVLESVTGDLLLPVKTHSDSVNKKWNEIERELMESKYPYLQFYTDSNAKAYFNPVSWSLFKACDLFELLLFVKEEIQLGNNNEGILAVNFNCCNILSKCEINYITERLG